MYDTAFITGQCSELWGSRRVTESSILFSFETDFTGRVKAGPQIETWQRRSAAAFTPAVILFIALPNAEDKTDPG
jgi:hypothetical protein